jgi:KUP system potassium uptake protein
MNQSPNSKTQTSALTLAALGVVFGDIGTSPLYTLQTIFSADSQFGPLTEANIFGILSLIFWTLIMVTSVKYIAFIMQANNRGDWRHIFYFNDYLEGWQKSSHSKA